MRLSVKKLAKTLVAGSLIAMTAGGAAHADATLDRIKAKGKLTVGVILSGAPFGYIDPTTQEQKGLNIDLAKELAKGLGVELATRYLER